MSTTSDFLVVNRLGRKVYEQMENVICKKYRLSVRELDVLLFLEANPEQNTLCEIVKNRAYTESHVSMVLHVLQERGLLQRQENRKRFVHLVLTEQSDEIIREAKQMQEEYREVLFQGFSMEEMEQYDQIRAKLFHNLKEIYHG
jgi:DNA-binding MarR family transcriptional regulator